MAFYRHTAGRCSIIGGYVYRGRAIPALVGSYIYLIIRDTHPSLG